MQVLIIDLYIWLFETKIICIFILALDFIQVYFFLMKNGHHLLRFMHVKINFLDFMLRFHLYSISLPVDFLIFSSYNFNIIFFKMAIESS